LKQFCFSDGETIHAEGGEQPMWRIGRAADKVSGLPAENGTIQSIYERSLMRVNQYMQDI
jgi:hypothetical protein